MNPQQFLDGLLAFLSGSPSPWHAVNNMAAMLTKAGFEQIKESDEWTLSAGGRYFVTRNDSSIIAFIQGAGQSPTDGIRAVGAHTDSPCLKVKPNPECQNAGLQQLGVEPYGGVLLGPWFDRDLSLAGRVSYRQTDGSIASALVDFKRPVAIVPSLAIHLDREVNKKRSINEQTQLPPVIGIAGSTEIDFRTLLAEELANTSGRTDISKVLEYEINLYDTQPAALTGLAQDFISSARLDNLLSCYIGCTALCAASDQRTCLLVCTDHEEVGSASACGAQGPFLRSVLERLAGDNTTLSRAIDRSVMISADNAHALHPNYKDRHDPEHAPHLNKGPVLKVNSNQRYASNSETASLFKSLCADAEVPMQTMVARSDMGCGSTIGPITAAEVGIPTVDVGVPQLAMHSIRELAGSQDSWNLHKVLNQFFACDKLLER